MMNADWQWVQLGEISEVISKGTTPTTHGVAFLDSGIPFLRAEDVIGGAVDVNSVKYYVDEKTHNKLLSRSQLQPGDFLITIAGSLGRVGYVPLNAPPLNCNQAVAFVRLKPNIIDLDFLLYIFQYEGITKSLLDVQKVGTIGNLNLEQIRDFKIPLPPLTEQKRIASLLARADRLRSLRRTAHELGESLLQSVFLEMFGKPEENPKGFDVFELGEIGTLDRGRSKNRPRNAPELYGGKYPFIQTGDIANADSYIRTYQQTYSELGLKQSKMWKSGTLCITIAANIAKTAILTFDACFPDSIVGFVPDKAKTNVEYVQYWLSFKQQELEDTAPESAQKNINLEILRGLAIPVPPLSLQEEFAGVVARVESLRGRMGESMRQVEGLFESLLSESFS